jgi:multidrug efflux pump subunit AcrB
MVSNSVLVSLSSSAMVSPNFWLNPTNDVTYPLVVQTPQYRARSVGDLFAVPLTGPGGLQEQLLMNVASVTRTTEPMVLSQINIAPTFDVQADVQGRDLGSAAGAVRSVMAANAPEAAQDVHLELAGQAATMDESFRGLFGGIGLAVVLVFLLLMIQFQSWIDPIIVLLAVPLALGGVLWMLFLTDTHISVPALMGTLMCIGLATANSILVVSFAKDRTAAGDDVPTAAVAAGSTRLRPVLMTAGAMILGMIPMALGVGEGGEQNAPLARAVIGGLVFATLATLLFVPAMYRLFHERRKNAQGGDS